MKKGAPTAAVIIPMGNSAGATMVLAIQSVSTKTAAPNNMDTGISQRILAPTSMRAMWGIIKPTKPIIPVNATAPQLVKMTHQARAA